MPLLAADEVVTEDVLPLESGDKRPAGMLEAFRRYFWSLPGLGPVAAALYCPAMMALFLMARILKLVHWEAGLQIVPSGCEAAGWGFVGGAAEVLSC